MAKDGADMLRAALEYLGRGFSILPIAPGTKRPPQGLRWRCYQERAATERTVRRWYGDGKGWGVGVVCGAVSGDLVVVDFDDPDVYRQWADGRPIAETLPTVRTGRGYQVYLRCRGVRLRKYSWGEVRGGGAYVVAPPSMHPCGRRYAWVVPLGDGLPAFSDLAELGLPETEGVKRRESDAMGGGGAVQRPVPPRPQHTIASKSQTLYQQRCQKRRVTLDDLPADVAAAVERCIDLTIPSRPGKRDDRVFAFARALQTIPTLRDMDPTTLAPLVRAWWHRAAADTSGEHDFGDSIVDFVYAWPRVTKPGLPGIHGGFERARESTVELGFLEGLGFGENMRLLAKLCIELQRNVGVEHAFWVSCYQAGPLLGVSPQRANKMLRVLAESVGLMAVAEPGRPGHPTRYRLRPEYRHLADGEPRGPPGA